MGMVGEKEEDYGDRNWCTINQNGVSMSKNQPSLLNLEYGGLHEKQIVLEVGVQDFIAHFSSSENKLAHNVVSEALTFGKAYRWNFWGCCFCGEKFPILDLYSQHVQKAHLNKLSFYSRSLPLPSSSDWESLILNGTWKPIDFSAAMPILEEQLELLRAGSTEAFNIGESKHERPNECEGHMVGDCSDKEEYSLESKAKEYYLSLGWPVSDDLEREKLLIGIHHILQAFLSEQTFTELLLKKVVEYSMKELGEFHPSLSNPRLGLHQTQVCICLLGVSPLQNILNYLKEVQCSINVILDVEKKNNVSDASTLQFQSTASTLQFGYNEKVALEGDSLQIFLDKRSLGVEIYFEKSNGYTDYKDSKLPLTDALFRWIWTGPSCSEQVESWTCLEQERKKHGTQILQELKKNDNILKDMFEERKKLFCSKNALKAMSAFCTLELSERLCSTKHVVQSFEDILQKFLESSTKLLLRLQEHKFLHIENERYKVESISSVINEAKCTMHEKTLIGLPSVSSSKCFFAKVKAQTDYPIEDAVERVTEINYLKNLANEACIAHTLMETQRLKSKIDLYAASDYRAVLLPLVKSYLQAQMKKFAGTDATVKTEVAQGVSRGDKTADCNGPYLIHKQIDRQRLVPVGTEKNVRVIYLVAQVLELSLNTD